MIGGSPPASGAFGAERRPSPSTSRAGKQVSRGTRWRRPAPPPPSAPCPRLAARSLPAPPPGRTRSARPAPALSCPPRRRTTRAARGADNRYCEGMARAPSRRRASPAHLGASRASRASPKRCPRPARRIRWRSRDGTRPMSRCPHGTHSVAHPVSARSIAAAALVLVACSGGSAGRREAGSARRRGRRRRRRPSEGGHGGRGGGCERRHGVCRRVPRWRAGVSRSAAKRFMFETRTVRGTTSPATSAASPGGTSTASRPRRRRCRRTSPTSAPTGRASCGGGCCRRSGARASLRPERGPDWPRRDDAARRPDGAGARRAGGRQPGVLPALLDNFHPTRLDADVKTVGITLHREGRKAAGEADRQGRPADRQGRGAEPYQHRMVAWDVINEPGAGHDRTGARTTALATSPTPGRAYRARADGGVPPR